MPTHPVIATNMTEGVPAPILKTARILMVATGLGVDWRRLKKVSGGVIEIDLNPDMAKVLAPPTPRKAASRRRGGTTGRG